MLEIGHKLPADVCDGIGKHKGQKLTNSGRSPVKDPRKRAARPQLQIGQAQGGYPFSRGAGCWPRALIRLLPEYNWRQIDRLGRWRFAVVSACGWSLFWKQGIKPPLRQATPGTRPKCDRHG